ncbi:DEAD/DEAH box helicase family protein [Alphaproteobacteria bacterium]|nr:DEAD/DEAH box helicase family protein [Alphaproteobacteria bacterium]
MSSFDQLLSNIRSHENYGKHFEVFCKWFLENDPAWSKTVAKVWLWDEYPNKWQQKDLGTDLVFEDKRGRIWAVQSKCYEETHSTTKNELNSFLADTSRKVVYRRLWMQSNSKMGDNALSTLQGQEKPVTILKLHDFRNANLDYPALFNDLRKVKAVAKPRPDPHQVEAIEAVVSGLKTSDRGQMIMACGTGKTFTTLWIKEALSAGTTLVLLPSLNLLSQTMREWAWGAKDDFDILNVCSDKSVGKKTEDMGPSEAPFPVTSEVSEIAAFLKRPSNKVLFCTYQSSALIAEVQKDKSIPSFDLAIADEAHRCAGKSDAGFSTILDAAKIRSANRLFTTATPRYFGKAVKDAAKLRDTEIIGMDNEELFGPVIHKLTFGEAIQRDLLNDYQVVVVGVDEPRVKLLIDNYELVSSNSDSITDARTLAAKVGLIKAIRDYDLKRVISFHSRVKGAKEFSSEFSDVVKLIKPDERPEGLFFSDYVEGKMKASDRADKIQQLKSLEGYDKGVLSNARCLAEGVDVPSLDGIAFIDPRGSQIEIIQAVGRAIRRVRNAASQSKGTIVIPVFIEEGDSPEASIEASNFKPVWDILKALRAHDEVLADTLDQYRTGLGRRVSNDKGQIDKVVFDLPTSVGLGFASALRAILVETSTSSWEVWFGELEEYLETHSSPPPIPNKKTRKSSKFILADWCGQQRTFHNSGTLSSDRATRLSKLHGWTWDPTKDRLIRNAKILREWCLLNKTWLVPDRNTVFKDVNVAATAKAMRNSKRNNTILPEVEEILSTIPGWVWSGVDEKVWEIKFEKYKAWHLNANCHSPPRDLVVQDCEGLPPFNLGSWLNQQTLRYSSKQGVRSLSSTQIKRFETEISFWRWSDWQRSFAGYQYAVEKLGFENIKTSTSLSELPLEIRNVGRWLSKQRDHCQKVNFYSSSRLTPQYLKELEKFGFDCDPFARLWHIGFLELLEYVKYNKTARVPQTHITSTGFNLGSWVSKRRIARSKNVSTDPNHMLRQRLLSELPDWNRNWADFRTVDYEVADDNTIRLISVSVENKKHLSNILTLSLYAGLRLNEIQRFKHVTVNNVQCIEIEATRGSVGFRLIPSHARIVNIKPIEGYTYAGLSKAFSDARPDCLPKELHITSLMLRFLKELERGGLSKEVLFMVANGSEREHWTAEVLKELSGSVGKLSYAFD